MSILLSHWSAPPGVLIPAAISLLLYEVGLYRMNGGYNRPAGRGSAKRHSRSQQRWLFVGGVGAAVAALVSPLDYWSGIYFWVHMIQHMVLLFLAAPLVVLGAPWLPMMRGLPAALRIPLLRWIYRSGGGQTLRTGLRWAGRPVAAAVGFDLVIGFWHLPVMFDATLHYQLIHDLEHMSFLAVGMWFWGQVVGSYPYSPRLDYFRRIWVISGVMFPNWALAIGMAYAAHPWYGAYGDIAGRHMSLINDQNLAGAIMWVVPMISLGIGAFWCLNKWLAKDADEDERLAELIGRTRLDSGIRVGETG